jgi:ribosomal protein S18 acetylase RimI-like enzyme
MNKIKVNIEPLSTADISACVQIMTENELWELYGVTTPGAEQMFSSALKKGAAIITAKVDGQTAGFAWYAIRGAWDRSAYLRLIGILPAYQGLGIGEQLLRAVESLAAQEVQDIFLLVTDSNTSAQRFYRRLGYQQVGAIPNYVIHGITEFIFYKRLEK